MECNNAEETGANETKIMDCAAKGTKEPLAKNQKCAKAKQRRARAPKARQCDKGKKPIRRRAKRGIAKKKKRCFRPGPITNNPYLNFLRFFRRNQCGISPQEVIRRGAIAWRRLPDKKRKRFQMQALMNKLLKKNDGHKKKVCKKPAKKGLRKPKARKNQGKKTKACKGPKKPKKVKKPSKKSSKDTQTVKQKGSNCAISSGRKMSSGASSSKSGKRSGSKSCEPKKC